MPRYNARCTKCNKVFDYYTLIKNRNDPQTCKCGGSAVRDVAVELNQSGDFSRTMRTNPRWSWSMGVNISEIPKMMKQYPDRKYNPVTGQLLVESRHHKKKLMRENGMYEYA